MFTAQYDTIAYQLKARPLTRHRDMSNVPTAEVAARVQQRMKPLGDSASPEKEALKFYMWNHAVAEVQSRVAPMQPLGEYLPILEKYHENVNDSAERLFGYLLLICTRESRHLKGSLKPISTKFGKGCGGFNSKIKGGGSMAAVSQFFQTPPNVSIGNYVKSLQYLFYHGQFSGGYGGPNWGAVSDALVSYVTGDYSPEMMLDTGWTLCHNNGPIFNKGMYYDSYNLQSIRRILDVQRAGQIPQMIGSSAIAGQYISAGLQTDYFKIAKILGECFEGYVDWFMVEELGSMGSYESEKHEQEAKHGLPTKVAAKVAAMKEAHLEAKKAELEKYFEIHPGLKVEKFVMERA